MKKLILGAAVAALYVGAAVAQGPTDKSATQPATANQMQSSKTDGNAADAKKSESGAKKKSKRKKKGEQAK